MEKTKIAIVSTGIQLQCIYTVVDRRYVCDVKIQRHVAEYRQQAACCLLRGQRHGRFPCRGEAVHPVRPCLGCPCLGASQGVCRFHRQAAQVTEGTERLTCQHRVSAVRPVLLTGAAGGLHRHPARPPARGASCLFRRDLAARGGQAPVCP